MATGFAISVKLVDLATGPLGRINRALFGTSNVAEKASQTSKKTAAAISGAVNKTAQTASGVVSNATKKDVPLLRDSLNELKSQTKEVGEGLLKAFAPFETLAIGTSLGGIIGGLGYLAYNFAAVGSSTQRMSQSLGLNIVDLQNWRGAAELAGVGAEAMTNSLMGVSHSIYMARNGLNPDMFRAAQQFGIDLNKGATDAERAANVILQVSDKIRNDPLLSGNVQAQHTLLSVLGIDDKMLPLLQQGRAAIEQYVAEAKRHGYITAEQAEAATALQRAYSGLRLSIDSTSLAIGAQLSQWLTPMLTQWADWLDKLRSTPGALGSVKKELEALANTNWSAVGDDLVHALLGDGKKWEDTGSRLMNLILKGISSVDEDFSTSIGKLESALGKVAEGFGKTIASDISKSFMDNQYIKDISKVFSEEGKVSAGVFANDFIKVFVDTLKTDPDLQGITSVFSNIFSNTDWMPDWLNKLTGGRPRGAGGTPGYGAKPAGPLDKKRESEALDYFQKTLGLTNAQAAGVVSTLEQESSLDPTSRNASGHFGIAQWDKNRQVGLSGSTDFQTQLAYVAKELQTTEAESLKRIKAASTPEESSVAMRGFERGGDYGGKDLTRARLIYNALPAVGANTPAIEAPKASGGAHGAAAPLAPLPPLPSLKSIFMPPTAQPSDKKPVGAPNVTTSPAGEMLTLPEIDVTAPAPKVPIPQLVPGGAAGKQGALNPDSSHTVMVHFANAPAGMRSGLTQSEGPATVAVRTQYSMDNLS